MQASIPPNQLWVTLPIPVEHLKPSTQMLTMTPAELHQMADTNSDGELTHVESLPFT